RPVPRGHAEPITVDDETEPVVVKLGVWISNTRARRAKLTPKQQDALRALGVHWAGPAPGVEAAPEPPAPQPAPSAAPKRRAVREHHEECDEELYEGGNCACWSIKWFGPSSERESYWDNL
ncbi:helicase associated domain-containing protein, partial [Streptomyces sp. NPDC048644]|uniref:helicase associated domain-containing protein n=1 Tax=Streptomyces sp. NPDC048644 TaxID=3365582 RepID=UPI003720FAB5